MKKNWIIFIVICAAAYSIFLFRESKKLKEYQAKQAEYTVQLSRFKEQEERANLDKEKARQELAEAQKKLAEESVPTQADEAATPGEKTTASVSQQRELLTKISSVDSTPQHVVDTPLYRVVLSEFGARAIDWEIKSSEYVRNLAEGGGRNDTVTVQLIPQVGARDTRSWPFELVGFTARDFNDALYTVTEEKIANATRLTFTSDPKDDMVVVKDFLFRDDSYVVDVRITFKNGTATRKRLGRDKGFGMGWQGGMGDPELADRVHGTLNFVGAIDDGLRTKRIGRDDAVYTMAAANTRIDWAGLEKKFFTVLLIPAAENPATAVDVSFEKKNDDPAYLVKGANLPLSVEFNHAVKDLEPSESYSLSYQVYAGPKNREAMKDDKFVLAPDAVKPRTLIFHEVPLGMKFMRNPCHWLLSVMKWLHGLFGTWGLAIICTTIFVRALIYPITHWAIQNQARTMVEQQKLRPEMDAINKKFKADPMKRNQAIMQLYRDHKVNPLGMVRGCFPVLLQMPIFMSLLVIFDQSVELRGQSFLWIHDLSAPDRLLTWSASLPLIGNSLNILPIIMGFTNFVQMRIMRMPANDETQEQVQKQMMYVMPVMLMFFLYKLPSGLSLYWVVSNIISIGQSYLTKRIIASHMEQHNLKVPGAKTVIEKS